MFSGSGFAQRTLRIVQVRLPFFGRVYVCVHCSFGMPFFPIIFACVTSLLVLVIGNLELLDYFLFGFDFHLFIQLHTCFVPDVLACNLSGLNLLCACHILICLFVVISWISSSMCIGSADIFSCNVREQNFHEVWFFSIYVDNHSTDHAIAPIERNWSRARKANYRNQLFCARWSPSLCLIPVNQPRNKNVSSWELSLQQICILFAIVCGCPANHNLLSTSSNKNLIILWHMLFHFIPPSLGPSSTACACHLGQIEYGLTSKSEVCHVLSLLQWLSHVSC